MPYVYMDELSEGMEEADVHSADDYNALESNYNDAVTRADELASQVETLSGERDNLAAELDDAKTKFANAFLSSPQRAKEVQADEVRKEDRPADFNSLFAGRNDYNAN